MRAVSAMWVDSPEQSPISDINDVSFAMKENNTRILLVKFNLTNNLDSSLTGLDLPSAMDLYLVTSGGRIILSSLSILSDNGIPSGLAPHATVTFWEYFEVPNGEAPVKVLYKGLGLTGDVDIRLPSVSEPTPNSESTPTPIPTPTPTPAPTLTPTPVQWVVSAYALTFGGFFLLGGRVSDILSRKNVFLTGLALFSIASFFGGLGDISGIGLHRQSGSRSGGRHALSPRVVADNHDFP